MSVDVPVNVTKLHEEHERLLRLFSLANKKQNDPEFGEYYTNMKQVLCFLLHGDPELKDGFELTLREENI